MNRKFGRWSWREKRENKFSQIWDNMGEQIGAERRHKSECFRDARKVFKILFVLQCASLFGDTRGHSAVRLFFKEFSQVYR